MDGWAPLPSDVGHGDSAESSTLAYLLDVANPGEWDGDDISEGVNVRWGDVRPRCNMQ